MNNKSVFTNDKLNKFLREHQIKDTSLITHLGIGGKIGNQKIYGGKYEIKEVHLKKFHEIYFNAIDTECDQFVVEKQQIDTGGLGIDLDFRYNVDVTDRIIDDAHLTDVVEKVVGLLNEMFDITDVKLKGTMMYIALKDEPILLDSVTKDGIHIYVPIVLDRYQRKMFYTRMLDIVEDLFQDDANINTYTDILDKGVINGSTGWQMLGSKKPGNLPYKIRKIYHLLVEDDEFDCDELSLKKNAKKYRTDMLIRNTNNYKFNLKPSMIDEYHDFKTDGAQAKNNKNSNQLNAFIHNTIFLPNEILNILNQEELDDFISNYLDHIVASNDYNTKLLHDCTMILNSTMYEPYDNWLMIGHALHYASISLFATWVAFSAKSEKFNFNNISEMLATWNLMGTSNGNGNSVTDKTIYYHAKISNAEEYEVIKNNSIITLINASIPQSNAYYDSRKAATNENDVAAVVYGVYNDEFVCSSAHKNIWYAFNGFRFKSIDDGIELKKVFSRKIVMLYSQEIKRCMDQIDGTENMDGVEGEHVKAKIMKLMQVSNLLKQKNFKSRLLVECQEFFHDSEFEEKLDSNINLLGVENGVIDFKRKCFRKGTPDDYISFNTGICYHPLDTTDKGQMGIKKEIENFFQSILPIKEVREYVLDYLASCLTGSTKNQTFTIFLGSGANGKSILMDLMSETLGNYKYKVPLSLLTRDRPGIGGPTSEIAQLKGRRLCVLDEPRKGDKLNEGTMKELTGGDPIAGRHLFKDQIVFVPQFKLAVTTNILPKIDSNDGGTWRRIKVVDFPSKFLDMDEWNREENGFVTNPDPNKYQFIKDENLKDKFPTWRPIFLAMLVERAYRTDGRVKNCKAVMERSNVYRNQMDMLNLFVTTRIVLSNSQKKLTKAIVKRAFDEWWQHESDGDRIKPSSEEIFEKIDKKIGKYNKGWKGHCIKYDSDSESDSDSDSDSE